MAKNNYLGNITLTVLSILFLFVSCKEPKAKTTPSESQHELKTAAIEYQCPMDCEKGKVYGEAGSCPVCKMDLAAKDHAVGCQCVKDGDCSCEEGHCVCKAEAEKEKDEKMCQCKKGECTCEEGNCKCGTPGWDHFGNKLEEKKG